MLLSCHDDGGGYSATVYTDSLNVPGNDSDTPTATANLKGLIQ